MRSPQMISWSSAACEVMSRNVGKKGSADDSPTVDHNAGPTASRTVDKRAPANLASLVSEIPNSWHVRREHWQGRRLARVIERTIHTATKPGWEPHPALPTCDYSRGGLAPATVQAADLLFLAILHVVSLPSPVAVGIGALFDQFLSLYCVKRHHDPVLASHYSLMPDACGNREPAPLQRRV